MDITNHTESITAEPESEQEPASSAVEAEAESETEAEAETEAETGQPWRDVPLSEFPQTYDLNTLPAMAPLTVPEPNWICGPVSMTLADKELVTDNFYTMLDHLDMADDADWALVRFRHWKAGSVCCVFVRPGSRAHVICSAIRRQLAIFPKLPKGRPCPEVALALCPLTAPTPTSTEEE